MKKHAQERNRDHHHHTFILDNKVVVIEKKHKKSIQSIHSQTVQMNNGAIDTAITRLLIQKDVYL